MKKIAIIAALAASVAAPAFAQSASAAFAIAHFNQSAERASDIITVTPGQNTRVSTTGEGPIAEAFEIFNRSVDRASDRIGLNGATVASGTPAYAQDVFARLHAESLDDE